MLCPNGGIGRRLGLKIPWEQSRAGSSPASGIMSINIDYISDGDIARAAVMAPIGEIAAAAGLHESELECYGKFKAKVDLKAFERLSQQPDGKLILVTAINPTPAGEGKTTVSIGLADALRRLDKKVMLALREPSLGPVFGMKGGATGGGYAQVLPPDEINLHFTGDIHAICSANNLLAAILDNHIYQGNALGIDPRSITWKRCVDMNDRQLRSIVSGLSGKANGVPREDGFDIAAASEVMAILCLSKDIHHLKENLKRITVGFTWDGAPVTAGDLNVHGAMAALLKNAFMPNLAQTIGRTPALIHGGPFANIAHGCNSIVATKLAQKLADYVVTEAGFGADLGAEKFFDIKCRIGGICPSACVIVASARALKHHGGAKAAGLGRENPEKLEAGMPNLFRHIGNMQNVFNIPALVAINRFPDDTPKELELIKSMCDKSGTKAYITDVRARGGEGGAELADAVIAALESGGVDRRQFRHAYDLDLPILEKIQTVARSVYGADGAEFSPSALKDAAGISKTGGGKLPVCIAKTQYSFSDNPKKPGAPTGFKIAVRSLKALTGAGFVVALTGDIMTMPGLPKLPAAESIDIDSAGSITGIF